MKILSAEQTRQADQATIEREPINAIDLMERASIAFVKAFTRILPPQPTPVYVFCGPGNNGGDGLAIARLLAEESYQVEVFTVQAHKKVSDDFATNRDRWQATHTLRNITQSSDLPDIPARAIAIDGLFGSGLSRPVEGVFADVVGAINATDATVVAIDVPSGLFTDQAIDEEAVVVQADHTFTFQLPKLAFLLPQCQDYVGHWRVLDIGLDAAFLKEVNVNYHYSDAVAMQGLRKSRSPQSHKGNYGKALLIAGSYGKMGAAVLSALACLRGGVGLLTVHVPECGYTILQTAVPEAMVLVDDDSDAFSCLPANILDGYTTLGIGPGLGTSELTVQALSELLPAIKERQLPLVLDADALNILGKHRELLHQLPEKVILTPHPKEFERLTEPARHDFHRLELLQNFCTSYHAYVVLKGQYTAVGSPEGFIYFNSTGNPGMATGGSGDVLTGLLTALLAQGYTLLEAARLGVYLHGLAGDLAAKVLGAEATIASSIVAQLGEAFQRLD